MKKEKAVYVVDDTFKISEEIENMSEEELDRRIKILEEKAREEGKNIPMPVLDSFKTPNQKTREIQNYGK